MNTTHHRHGGGPRGATLRRFARAGLLGVGATLLTGCGTEQLISIGDLSSASNREVFWMSVPAIAFSIIIFIGVSWALFYSVQKFREDRNENAPAQFHGNNRLEVILVVVPVLIVVMLSVLTVRTMARINPTPREAVDITVLARQFWWNFGYPGAPAAAGGTVTNGNELIIPTRNQVAVTVGSGDVMHGFWAPNLGGQRFATPGAQKTWQIDTDRPGVYQGNCSFLCGASHANMRYKVIALEPERYNAFLRAAQAYRAPTPATGSAEARGYTIFMEGKASTGALACASCHRVQGTPANGAAGPDLSFFGSRRTLGAGLWEGERAREMLIPWLANSPGVKPGSLMPTYDGSEYRVNGEVLKGGVLTRAELEDVAAYLRSLQLPEEANYWRDVPIIGGPESVEDNNASEGEGGNS
ncbi:cytochrome c oxidase subunit II [Deinococcus sp. YIM 134068]|uniref:cytochrome c oxidase subunit II n=1 Tax=Deinococcus lichenicola TaxID=3118910 RepID=UPI003FA46DB8